MKKSLLKGTLLSIYAATTLNASVEVFHVIDDVIRKADYSITGYFTYHKFSVDEKSNWVFSFVGGNESYQLLGEKPTETNIFGWKKTDVKVSKPEYYMVHYDKEDRFGWLIFKTDENGECTNIYKLAGQRDDGSFNYDIDKNNIIDDLRHLTSEDVSLKCKIDLTNNKVHFRVNKFDKFLPKLSNQ